MIDVSTFQLLLMVVTGWLTRREREVIVYLIEENRCLRRQLGRRRMRARRVVHVASAGYTLRKTFAYIDHVEREQVARETAEDLICGARASGCF